MQEVTGYGDNASKEIDDELLQNMQQLISAACASRGRWGGWKEVKMFRTKCRKCLKGARISITGLDKNTLRMDMGGAVLYLTPKEDGKMEVALNSENLIDGDYAFATWTGNKWLVD